jgi:signal transduction histidine kinase
MSEHSTSSETDAPAAAGRRSAALRERLAALAEIGRAAAAADLVIIAHGAPGADQIVRAPAAPSRWDKLGGAAIASLGARLLSERHANTAGGDDDAAREFTLGTADTAAAFARAKVAPDAATAAACGFAFGRGGLLAAAVAAPDSAPLAVRASLRLVARAALAELKAAEAVEARTFWRERAAEAQSRAGHAEETQRNAEAGRRDADRVVAEVIALAPRRRFERLGEIVARYGGFDAWAVASEDRGELKLVAAWARTAAAEPLGPASLLKACIERRETLVREPGARRGFSEDRILGTEYVCIPLERGAIGLAARGALAPEAHARVEALLARLRPILRLWAVEAEAEAYRSLVGRLALRMFSAIDDERARIARDLHDDQAQLLVAAKLALEGGRDAARVILGRLETELRARTRTLRPATLASATLIEALERELGRVRDAGIDARLERGDGGGRISRGVQQLCFQVAREALSNVLRHARATAVTLELGRIGPMVHIAIADNGRGIDPEADQAGSGIKGLAERVELMGGRLRIVSHSGGTTVRAEIPEPV